MANYGPTDKTDWFFQELRSGYFSRQEIIDHAAASFPGTSRKTLEGTIGQYWSDCVNPKWWASQQVQARGLQVSQSGPRRRLS